VIRFQILVRTETGGGPAGPPFSIYFRLQIETQLLDAMGFPENWKMITRYKI
jgi:hypothetical protein